MNRLSVCVIALWISFGPLLTWGADTTYVPQFLECGGGPGTRVPYSCPPAALPYPRPEQLADLYARRRDMRGFIDGQLKFLPQCYTVEGTNKTFATKEEITKLRTDLESALNGVKTQVPQQVGEKVGKVVTENMRDVLSNLLMTDSGVREVLRDLINTDPDFRKTVKEILKEK